MIRLDDEVAVVTGAGRGLGRSYALALAERGAAVLCNDLDGDRAAATADEIVGGGGAAVAEASSVASPEGGAAIVQAALTAFGSVDIVVNNAGQLRNAAFEELTPDDVDQVAATHCAGAFWVTQPAYRHMRAAGHGRIVFTSSSAGMFGSPWQANYAAAKAGVVGLCKVVALEGARHGISANAILPMALTDINEGGPPPYAPEDLADTIDAIRPLAPRMVVENVAPLVVYLASRQCRETGQIFSVGAGHIARVVIGTGTGWHTDGDLTPEEVEANLSTILDLDGFAVPENMNDELRLIARRSGKVR